MASFVGFVSLGQLLLLRAFSSGKADAALLHSEPFRKSVRVHRVRLRRLLRFGKGLRPRSTEAGKTSRLTSYARPGGPTFLAYWRSLPYVPPVPGQVAASQTHPWLMVNGPGKTYEVALEKLDLVSTQSRSSSVSARRPFRTPEGGAEETRGVQEHSIDHILATGIETSHEQNSCRTTWVYFARSTRSHHSRTRTIARQPAPALASAELQS